ncbi:MAG: GNAT family N-acetyltransferase [Actinobacteria bacterium]|nr:MAG: GNAT family N-acetyltransferase [Actinomycetota bacterium]
MERNAVKVSAEASVATSSRSALPRSSRATDTTLRPNGRPNVRCARVPMHPRFSRRPQQDEHPSRDERRCAVPEEDALRGRPLEPRLASRADRGGPCRPRARLPVGAAWYRLFTAEEPGYGFVDDKIPELSIAVVPLHRRKGIGEALLRSCMVQAREEGFQALSLSVAVHNRSRMMYQKAGFEKVEESGGNWTMVANL